MRKHIKNHSLRDSGQKRRKSHREPKSHHKNHQLSQTTIKHELEYTGNPQSPNAIESRYGDFQDVDPYSDIKQDTYLESHVSNSNENFINFNDMSDCLINLIEHSKYL